MTGLLLALQFFTSLPVRRELPMDRRTVTVMYGALPWVGALIGILMLGIHAAGAYAGFSPLLTAALMLAAGVILTGGLHLDGVADTCDAFFSYQDRKRRHEILGDPRIGAFGVLGLLVLVLLKFAVLYEWAAAHADSWGWVIIIPFLSRSAMAVYFVITEPAKETGIAHFFRSRLNSSVLAGWTAGCLGAAVVLCGRYTGTVMLPLALAAVIAGAVLLFRFWSRRHFGGVTGDLCGAFIEGMEVLLWITVLSLS
ncbi:MULTISPECIES: adenosylcobinamide-GDP ribazoletransferase [Sporosarcina]|uniref:adenosylcobinamide-GDP ribazoletransferase n=2 Tax=Caryophanaceae TaxID=186818 RepID=UPI00058B4390|nr:MULTISPECIES: adenosylcobinamide-GDP ribazoletransferase [Sporosarcina]WJY26545.1 adenosylcobinamide-GDP ribazoletransferase [Sporosarcina sp. 0.2-SM1T-5]